MAHVGFHHRLAARISALTDFAVKLGRVALTLAPSLEQVVFIRIKLTRTQGTRSRQRGGLVVVGNTCALYYEPDPVLLQSCAGSSRLHAVPVPSDTVSICARDVLATSADRQGLQKKMRGAY